MIYFLYFPEIKCFKIGQTVNPHWNYMRLRSSNGEPDLENSFFIQIPCCQKSAVEGLMHFTSRKYRMQEYGREFFRIKGFEECLETAIRFCKTNSDTVLSHWLIDDWTGAAGSLRVIRDKKLELNKSELIEKRKFLRRNRLKIKAAPRKAL
ncbi:hypothetical protein CBI30_07320 [Polynucleobacter aenigmaticus]|uniref:Bacteriophage T5 Orf172 DNA-binding domain-containing protein n=2 Tax=Polynucleobacter aenigmaticus TaxID=1743164 RepID=A0A254PY71_9BURK|nr:hypothetical protein CBI30_07320 [Polynucleobacter aenigmaticus]